MLIIYVYAFEFRALSFYRQSREARLFVGRI